MQSGLVTRKNSRWLSRRYGSRRGFVLTYWYRLLFYVGKYRQYQNIDWHSVERLVFVCKGNICRSAYAEVVAQSLGIDAISCGLDTIEGAPANKDAILAAQSLGFDLVNHRARQAKDIVLKKTDLLIAMEPWQCGFLNNDLFIGHHCTLLGIWVRPALPHIQDPYGTPLDYFKKCFTIIEKSVYELSTKIK